MKTHGVIAGGLDTSILVNQEELSSLSNCPIFNSHFKYRVLFL